MLRDIISDNNPSFLTVIELPDWVKQAEVISEEEVKNLHASAFADPVHRKHPMHSKVATYMSAVYLGAQGVPDTAPEMQAVKSASAVFGIGHAVADILSILRSQVKSAATSELLPRFALTVKVAAEDAEPTGFYPLTSAVQIQDSAVQLVKDFNAGTGELPMDWFKSASETVMRVAPSFGLAADELPADVREMAEPRVFDRDKALDLVGHRKFAGISDELLEVYRDTVKSAGAEGGITVEEAVSLIETLDRASGIKYSTVFVNPWRIFHSGPSVEALKKVASQSVFLDQVMIPAIHFSTLNEASVRSALGKETADTVMQAVKLASTNPAEASALLAPLSQDVQREVLVVAHKTLRGLSSAA